MRNEEHELGHEPQESTEASPVCTCHNRPVGIGHSHSGHCKPAPAPDPASAPCTCGEYPPHQAGDHISAPAPEPKQGMCAGCGHQKHGVVCMNFASDNECPCKAGEPKQGCSCPMTPPPFPRRAHSKSCPERPDRLTVDGEPKQGSEELIERGGHSHAEVCFDPSCQKPGILTVFEAQNQTIAALRAENEKLKKLHSDHCSNPICEGPRS